MADLAAKDNSKYQIKKELFGLSTGNKPFTNIPIGSTFFETDTWDNYIYSSEGWVKSSGDHLADRIKGLDITLCLILDELKYINRQLYL